ncbi:hypothetical protein LK540_21535 [Massilia sp. IC2-278]|uniref:RHS repeat domain-containing protein n=1 Tax=Massilia sp. IC2-278 TaxID=2887200 RepID=UPI001E32C850|nr:RHS repeat domain-containing protein [Massilia sp. IC2-278]MCC2963019.1 hypothetical protein [Massilia sp. IC2-278]
MQAAILRRYRYAPSGQLTSVEDNGRGRIEYRYDPVGRLLAAHSALGHETFAFTLTKDLCVGKAYALANDQYGPGGGLQYFISKNDRRTLTAGAMIPLTNP